MRRTREIPVIIISKESEVRPNYVLCDCFLVRIDVLFAFHLKTVCMSRKSPKFVCVIDPFRRQLWVRFYPEPIARRAPGRVKRRRARASASRRPQPRTEHSSSASVSSRNADVHAEEPRLRTRRPAPPSSLPRDGTTQLQGKLRATGGERVSGRREPSCHLASCRRRDPARSYPRPDAARGRVRSGFRALDGASSVPTNNSHVVGRRRRSSAGDPRSR